MDFTDVTAHEIEYYSLEQDARGTGSRSKISAQKANMLDDRVNINRITPLFLVDGVGVEEPIPQLLGHSRRSLDKILPEAKRLKDAGSWAVALYGFPNHRDPNGSAAFGSSALVQKGLALLKAELPELVRIADLCLCQFTPEGQCGIIRDGAVDNDLSRSILADLAVELGHAGADYVMPSGMIDGAVSAIRDALDSSGQKSVRIVSQAAKLCSALYGPFRNASHMDLHGGGKQSYQLDPGNLQEAVREILTAEAEGADIVMVKPGFFCGDILATAKARCQVKLGAFLTSGECGLLWAGGTSGAIDIKRAHDEVISSLKRAGAHVVLSYI